MNENISILFANHFHIAVEKMHGSTAVGGEYGVDCDKAIIPSNLPSIPRWLQRNTAIPHPSAALGIISELTSDRSLLIFSLSDHQDFPLLIFP
jgi:hypothetical protein